MKALDYRTKRLGYTKVKTDRRLLLDRYPGAVAAYSFKKLRKDYLGPCVMLRKRVGGSADYHAYFGFRFGDLDWEAVQRWLEGNDDGLVADEGNVWIAIWYNQVFSNVGDMVEHTAEMQPLLDVQNRRLDTLGDQTRGMSIHWPNINQNFQLVSDVSEYRPVITDAWLVSHFFPMHRNTFSQFLNRSFFNFQLIDQQFDGLINFDYTNQDFMAMCINSTNYLAALKKNGQVETQTGSFPSPINATYTIPFRRVFYAQNKTGNYYFRATMLVFFNESNFDRALNFLDQL